MDEFVVSYVDTDVSDITAAGVEAENVTGLYAAGVDMDAVRRLIGGNSVDGYTEVLEYVVDKTGTVKARIGRSAAPAVFIAEEASGKVHNILTGDA